ncbi:hypothetical protein LTR04_001646 [Oleoguttula sp. CCFEE 6159]|nr:hypothetical protein LTR04_001646 [Oleoguttula sp. CCFEE 6159]
MVNSQYPDLHSYNNGGLEIRFDGTYDVEGQEYYQDDMYSRPAYRQGGSADPPLTPKSTTASEGGRRVTRSGRPIAHSGSPHTSVKGDKAKVTKPKVKKPKASKVDKQKTAELTAPLSELTKNSGIPIKNMEEWVNRSAEVRRAEVAKRKGYVTRPMNSFMLYRSAYAERTKFWCSQNNHQVVSSVSGESWPLEPAEVRERYNKYALIERANHQLAHPSYKFSPNKPTTPARSKKIGEQYDEDDDEEEKSDSDDPDAEWGPPTRRKKQARPSRREERQAVYPTTSNYHGDRYDQNFDQYNDVYESSWDNTPIGKPMPAAYGHDDLYFRPYYPTAVHQNALAPRIEELRERVAHQPSQRYGGEQSLIGLPGGQHPELLRSRTHTPVQYHSQIDPSLLDFDGQQIDPRFLVRGDLESNYNAAYEDYEGGHAQAEVYQSEHWQSMGPMETGSEFDKYMSEHRGV